MRGKGSRTSRADILAACLIGVLVIGVLAAHAAAQEESVLAELPEGVVGLESVDGASVEGSSVDDLAFIEGCAECRRCPEWSRYAVFDALVLQRTNQTGHQPVILNLADQTLATTEDLDPSVGTGLRAVYGELASERYGWEAGYTGLWDMFGSAEATGPDNLRTPAPLAYVISNFGDAHTARATYLSSLNMAEINVFRYASCGEACRNTCTDTGCTGCGDGAARNCRYLHALLGFVWAGLDERAGLDMICCSENESASYDVRTSTNYFGAQIGMQGRREWRRWAVEGWWKTALCGVNASQSSDPIVGSIYGSRGARSAQDGGLGFIGNLNASLVYRVTDVWGLRAGYNVICLTNAALAPSQWDFTDTPSSGRGINDNGTVLLHGANLGLEARW